MKRSNYITREGWERLDKELKYLWKEERPLITKSVSEAAAQGDRSENAEWKLVVLNLYYFLVNPIKIIYSI